MQVRDGERQGWYAAPSSHARRGVVIIHEIAGLNDDMRRIAGIFADHGYHALVPRLFRNAGCLIRSLRELSSGPGTGEVAAEVESWRRWLSLEQGADQVAVCGFCMGGGFALAFAATPGDRGLPVVAAHYAAVPEDVSRSCPVVASYGEDDRLFRGAGPKLASELAKSGIDHDVKTYARVGHSFMQRYSGWQQLFVKVPGPMAISYDEATANDAWRRLFAFFDRHLPEAEESSGAGG